MNKTEFFVGFLLVVFALHFVVEVDNPYEASKENYPKISLIESITAINLANTGVSKGLSAMAGLVGIVMMYYGFKHEPNQEEAKQK